MPYGVPNNGTPYGFYFSTKTMDGRGFDDYKIPT